MINEASWPYTTPTREIYLRLIALGVALSGLNSHHTLLQRMSPNRTDHAVSSHVLTFLEVAVISLKQMQAEEAYYFPPWTAVFYTCAPIKSRSSS